MTSQTFLIEDQIDRIEPGISATRTDALLSGSQRPQVRKGDVSVWWPLAEKQFAALLELGTNWDGDGANAVELRIVASAKELLRVLVQAKEFPKPHIFPTRSGGLQLEWEQDERYFEIEFVSPFAVEFYYTDGRSERVGQLFSDSDAVAPLLTLIDDVTNS